MDIQEDGLLIRGAICCSGELYPVQEGYKDVQEVYSVQGCYMLFGGVTCCSGGLYGCSVELCAV